MKDPALIPAGPYCYKMLAIEPSPNEFPIVRSSTCPYYSRNVEEGTAHCSFLGIDDDLLLTDHVKLCKVKEDYDNLS